MEAKCVKRKVIKSDSNLKFLDEVVNYGIMVLPTKRSIGNFVYIYYIFLLSLQCNNDKW